MVCLGDRFSKIRDPSLGGPLMMIMVDLGVYQGPFSPTDLF